MADYKELLRRAVEALPENNGAARRAVYEKARAALVGQLRAINPPLAARDITAHRLQLEDCIRQVEQEASEAVIAGLGSGKEDNPPPPPVYFEPPAKKAPAAVAKPVAKPVQQNGKEPPKPLPPGGSIEEIIAAANAEQTEGSDRSRSIVRPDAKPMGKPVPKLVPSTQRQPAQLAAPVPSDEDEDDGAELPPQMPARSPIPAKSPAARSPLPSIVARAEAAKSRTGNAAFGAPIAGAARGPVLEPRRELSAPRLEAAGRNGQATARQISEPVALFSEPPIAAAMSAVREVEVEAPADPQVAIDRAIATLDREARGDTEFEEPIGNGVPYRAFEDDEADEQPRQNGFAPAMLKADARPQREGKAAKASAFARDAREPRGRKPRDAEPSFPRARAEDERRGLGAVTIFLIVFAVLLVGAGGAGFWAWREGFIDLDQMFGRGPTTTQQATATPAATTTSDTPATGPGNTATPAENDAPAAVLATEDRLGADTAEAPAALSRLVPPAPEERLTTDQQTPAADAAQAAAAVDPAGLAGSQSLLLEASDSGTTGAVPFSGTVEWSKGTDEMGLPTLIGKANIPARNLAVDVLIRKNSDASLPASHLMEVNFRVTDSFIGGSIAGLPGVLLKNEELVQGTPLVGASARVVGNSFLFALSASPADITANSSLLISRKWIDLALIYATGKRAIITLEKDAEAEKMFTEVVGEWTKSVAAQAN
ncbi:hypothetical protein [Devosia sp. A16]|uniref:hypothetical protein n=1 Tax=Devosia sp. A16 TaxID=1736675 RepID=UPI000AE48AD0|nr:hypothetical protein [Devosia sp. A16]